MKKLHLILCSLLSIFCAYLYGADTVVICNENGRTASIILPPNCSKNTQYAAEELQTLLEEITGAKFSISAKETSGAKIYLDIAPEKNDLKGEKSAAVTRNGNLYLYGTTRNGALYAVYHFLQDELGCRFLNPYGDKVIPPKKVINVKLNKVYDNGLDFRCIMTYIYQRNRKKTFEFFFRNGQNWEVRSKDLGYLCKIKAVGKDHHSIFKFMPPDKYFKDNPEFYTMDKSGKRVRNKQMCFSSIKMREVFVGNVSEHLKENNRYNEALQSFDQCWMELSAMDYGGKFCYCSECMAKEKKYGTPCGAFFEFLADISAKLKNDFPKLKIATLIYRKEQTEIPPSGLIFPENFVAIFAPIDDNVLAPFDHISNQETYGHLKKWCKIAKNIWLWYYPDPYDCYLGPYSALRRTCRDFMLAKEAGITGTIYEHDITARSLANFADLESWTMLRIFGGYTDYEALIKEYMQLAYGKAADLVYQYFNELENLREDAVRNGKAGNYIVSPEELKYFTPANLERWHNLFEQAEKRIANDEAALFRLRKVRYELDMMILRKFHDFAPSSTVRNAAFKSFADRLTDTLTKLKKANVTTFNYDALLAEIKVLENFKFKNYAPEDVRIVFYNLGNNDADSLNTIAKSYSFSLPFSIYAHDYVLETVGNKIKAKWTLLQKSDIKAEDVIPDKYHYYKLGRVKLSSASRLSMTSNALFFRNIGVHFDPANPDAEWDVYFSMKFEGPAVKGSKAKINRFYCDHFVLVRKKAATAVLPAELKNVPADKIITVYPTLRAFNSKNTIEDENAARGKAVWENFGEKEFYFGTYDNKTKANKRCLTFKSADIKSTDGYEFFKIPQAVTITPDMLLYANRWLINIPLGSAVKKTAKYTVYISLKNDVAAKKSYCDKVIMVPAE